MSDEEKDMPRGDFITSIIMIVFSGWIIYLSLVMRRFQPWGLSASPGLSPLVFASLLMVCGLILFVRSIRKKGYRILITTNVVKSFFRSMTTRHFLVVLGSIFIYYLFLGVIHFALISSIFVFFLIWYFKDVAWWKNLLISVIASTAIWFSFDYLFLIPLP